jgi:hypothetical protein
MVSLDPEQSATKLLRPGVEGRSCRSWVLGVPLGAGSPDVREALVDLLARDPEGDVVQRAEIRWEDWLTGAYNRRCIVVRGDLARQVRVITLPTPGGQHHHEGSE